MLKKIISLHLGGLTLLAGSLSFAADDATTGKEISTDVKQPKNEERYLKAFGWVVGNQSGATQLGLTDQEVDHVLAGFKSATQGTEAPLDMQTEAEDMQAFFQGKAMAYQGVRQKELAKEGEENQKTSTSFYEKLDKDDKVTKTESGLYYEVTKKGTGEFPTENSVVKVDYEGSLINGHVFDSSKKRGEVAEFNLQYVIPGFREGLQHVSKGGSIRLYIPPSLAYGNQDIPEIPPGSTLIFNVDMIDVAKPEEAENTPQQPE